MPKDRRKTSKPTRGPDNNRQLSPTPNQTSSKKKVKKKDLRGPQWKANLDYVHITDKNEKKKYPVIKGANEVFDLQREYQTNPEKFLLDDLSIKLKTKSTTEAEKIKSMEENLPKFKSKLGFHYLHFACEPENQNSVGVLKFLLEKTATIEEIDVQNRFLQTPLHLATIHGLKDHVELLLEAGADPRIVTTDGYNAVDLAKLNVPKEITNFEEPPGEVLILSMLEKELELMNQVEEEEVVAEANVPVYEENVQKYAKG